MFNKKTAYPKDWIGGQKIIRRRPTLPPGDPSSTIGAGGLNGSVRNGKRCDPSAMVTGKIQYIFNNRIQFTPSDTLTQEVKSNKMVKPHGQLVLLGFTRCRASTCSLSTS